MMVGRATWVLRGLVREKDGKFILQVSTFNGTPLMHMSTIYI
jgi:hypothetical protein